MGVPGQGQGRKGGRLGLNDIAFIKQNYSCKTPAEIALSLNRRECSIIAYLDRIGISQKPPVDATQKNVVVVVTDLRKTREWKHLEKELVTDELYMFESGYSQYISQFKGDVLATEKTQIMLVVKLEILMHRNLKDKKRIMTLGEDIEKRIIALKDGKPYESLPAEKRKEIYNLEQTIISLQKEKEVINSEYVKNMERHGVIMRELKATRDQRIRVVDNSKVSFLDFIKRLQNDEIKEAEGRQMEILKRAATIAYNKLAADHVYADGIIDKPILNAETYAEINTETDAEPETETNPVGDDILPDISEDTNLTSGPE